MTTKILLAIDLRPGRSGSNRVNWVDHHGRRYISPMSDWPALLCDPGSLLPIPGVDESVAAGRATIADHAVVLVWCEFEVAAGTLSVAGGRRFVEAARAAIADHVPLIAIANSGGARMQEGTRAFVQMIGCTAAVADLEAAGLPFVVYLANPTMGGVFASWASLGHVTFAEPGASIGFTGPRVAAALGEPILPANSQTAEGLLANGMVDDVVARDALRERLVDVLDVVAPAPAPMSPEGNALGRPDAVTGGLAGWSAVEASREPGRVDVLASLIDRSDVTVELCGDRTGGVDAAVFAGLVRFDSQSMVVVGHRRTDHAAGRPTAAGLRLASRAMVIAETLGLPVLTVVDTAGAVISGAQEATGFAREIARSIDRMLSLAVPTVAVIAGQGSGGAAIAWMATDRVIAASDSWVAPIAPEAGSLIVHRDSNRAAELADLQRVGATELADDGIIDEMFDLGELVDAAIESVRRVVAMGDDRVLADRRIRFDRG